MLTAKIGTKDTPATPGISTIRKGQMHGKRRRNPWSGAIRLQSKIIPTKTSNRASGSQIALPYNAAIDTAPKDKWTFSPFGETLKAISIEKFRKLPA
jgi:hypothetical protein